jgi:hypothetical protein
VTLIELLIAISLLSLLSGGMIMALHVGVNALEKTNSRMMDTRRMTGVQRILEQQIAGFMPVMADCEALPGSSRARLPFFQGEVTSMRFVSSFSLAQNWRGGAQLLEFLVIPGQHGEGVRLVVNELAYTGSRGAGQTCLGYVRDDGLGLVVPAFLPVTAGPQSFVLADRLAYCRFSYREQQPAPVLQRWTDRWIARSWPNAIRIEMAPIEADAVRIRPLSITAPLRVNAPPGVRRGR